MALTLILIITMTLSDFMNNAATAAVICPIAISVAEQLQVNPARIYDALLILPTVGLEVQGPPVRNVRIAWIDIDVVKQVLLHEAPVTLRVRGVQAHVLVQIKSSDEGEVEVFLAMHADQFPIGTQGSPPCRQSEHTVGLSTNE